MGDYTSFAAVTRALVNRLQSAISETGGPVGNAVVLPRAPDVPEQLVLPCITLFLYHVVPNADFRNEDLPTRGQDGKVVKRPRAAFDLFYMLSFYGADTPDRMETQLLWGLTTAEFHANPFLSPADVLSAQIDLRAGAASLEAAIADAHELRIVTHGLDTDTMSRLWQSFPFANYVPSMVYKVGPCFVGIDEWPAPPLPIRQRALHKSPAPRDQTKAGPTPDDGVDRPYSFGDRLRIHGVPAGQNDVWLGSTRIKGKRTGDGVLVVRLTDPGVPIGPAVDVRLANDPGTAADFTIDLRPVVGLPAQPVSRDQAFEISIQPPPGAPQDARLYLNARNGGHGRILTGLPTDGTGPGAVLFPPANLPSGEYLARVSVSATDGTDRRVESLLNWQAGKGQSAPAFSGPILTLSDGGGSIVQT